MGALKVWRWGSTSLARLNTCHPKLQAVANRALELSMVDITVVCGHRSVEEQQRLYAIGRTTEANHPPVTYVDGEDRKSRHNYEPSLAVDLAPYIKNRGIAWDDGVAWGALERAMKRAAEELGIGVEWGGDWTSFVDKPHWQLKGPVPRLLRSAA